MVKYILESLAREAHLYVCGTEWRGVTPIAPQFRQFDYSHEQYNSNERFHLRFRHNVLLREGLTLLMVRQS